MLGKGNHEYAFPFYNERRPILIDFVMQASKDNEKKYTNFKRQGDKISAESYVPALAGGKLYVHATATALRNSDGAVTGAIESILDITARKQADVALRESEERFRLISENVADLITVIDGTGMCFYASPSFRQEGIDPGEIVGTNFLDYVHPGDSERVKGRLESVFSEQKHHSLEFRLRNQGGAWQFKEATMSLLVNDGDARILAVIRDVTDRIAREDERSLLQSQIRQRNLDLETAMAEMKQMQDGMVQSEKMASIGQLTAGIAHEINNPLAFVSSNLNRFREYFEEILAVLRRWGPLRPESAGAPDHAALAPLRAADWMPEPHHTRHPPAAPRSATARPGHRPGPARSARHPRRCWTAPWRVWTSWRAAWSACLPPGGVRPAADAIPCRRCARCSTGGCADTGSRRHH